MKLQQSGVAVGSVTGSCYNRLKPYPHEAEMADFTITEDFPQNEIDFDARTHEKTNQRRI